MTGPLDLRRRRQVVVLFWFLALALGIFRCWGARYAMRGDAISYLDIADAFIRGDWRLAINGHWSPLYPWLLSLALRAFQPSPYWEFAVVHLVDFVTYLGGLAGFHFFLVELFRLQQNRAGASPLAPGAAFPEWVWLPLGYTLFLWSSLVLILAIPLASPDMAVAAVVYLASGILLRIRNGGAGWSAFVALGAVLGLGYLTKAILFPLAFVFLAVALVSAGELRRRVPRVLVSLLVFGAVAGPYAMALSRSKGRLTFGDAGRLNYAWKVNGIAPAYVHWQGGPPRSGVPVHPTRKVFDRPAVFEFAYPIAGTYPPWLDPSYWHEGLQLYFDLGQQLRTLRRSLNAYVELFVDSLGGLLAGFLILCLSSGRRWRCLRDVAEQFLVIVPAVAALGMYALVLVDSRYIGALLSGYRFRADR